MYKCKRFSGLLEGIFLHRMLKEQSYESVVFGSQDNMASEVLLETGKSNYP